MPPKAPIRALARALDVLRALSRDGAQTHDRLVAATGLPRASLARLLDSLALVGAAARDPSTRRWHALIRVLPIDGAVDVRARCRPHLVAAASALGHSAELYAVHRHGLTMIERADPERGSAAVRARLGHTPDSGECSALAQIAHAFAGEPPRVARWWTATAAGPRALPAARARRLIAAAGTTRIGRDAGRNDIGIRRYAIPVQESDGALVGVLAIACADGGPRTGGDEAVLEHLTRLDARLNQR